MGGRARKGVFGRLVSITLVLSLAYSSGSAGINGALLAAADFAQRALQGRVGPFTDRPLPAYRGVNPSRDPATRGGLWNARTKAAAAQSRMARLLASTSGALPPPTHTLACEEAPGAGLPWEGQVNSPGGQVNSGNGNKLTRVPLVSWEDRGGMAVDFTLFHNSQSDYNDELGHGWTWTYDIYIYESMGTAIVHWGDGTAIPFSQSMGGGGGEVWDLSKLFASLAFPSAAFDTDYDPPAGLYDKLVKHTDGTWTLTQKDQTEYRFNDDGFCQEIEDRNGNTVTLTLNQYNYVTEVTGPSGRSLTISLDQNNNFTSVEDPLGRVWTFDLNSQTDELDAVEWPDLDQTTYTDAFEYDASHRITTHTDRRGKEWDYSYNSDGSLASATNPLSHTTGYTYTASATTITLPGSQTIVHNYSSGKLVSIADQASFSESYSYNASNQVTGKTDRRGKSWSYTYDSRGNVLTVTNPLSKTWTFTYSSENDLLSAEDPLENLTAYDYDAYGNLETVTDPLERVVQTNTYDSYGQVLSTTNGEEETTTLGYDTSGNLTDITDPEDGLTEIAYNGLGWVTSVTDPNGITESFAYDEWGRLSVLTHDDEEEVLRSYNEVGRITSVTNERGKVTSYTYDDAGRLTQVTNAEEESGTYAYNSNGWLTSVTNGRGKTRNYAYTARGEVYTLTLADSSVETWSYNGNGQVSAYTNPLSQTVAYAYDDAGRMIGVDYPTGTDTAFSYDFAGRRAQMTDATGTTNWTYDAASQLTLLETPEGEIAYAYDDAGRRTSMDVDGVGVTSYAYDDAGRLVSLENPFEEVTAFVYDAGGRETQRTFDSGAYTVTGYDVRNRVTSIAHKTSAHSTISSESYEYDAAGNLVEKTVNSVTTEYAYDDIDQLVSEVRNGYSASYTYDANGNRTSKTLNGTTQSYVVDDADKLTSITQGGNTVKSFTYDAAGRTTAVTVGNDTTSIAYDYESRITQITYPNQSTNTFAYNGLDTRVSKVDSTGSRTYLRDGAYVTDPVLSDGAATYTPGVSERRSGTTKFYHPDRLGTTERLTDTSESTTDTRQYDAFGLLTSSSGSTPTPFGFAGAWGYQEDPDSGLKLLGHRYYDPSTGRFLTRDPVKDGRNWYGYCAGNPVSRIDQGGFAWWPLFWQGDVTNHSNLDVLVIGEPGYGKPQILVLLKPGQSDPFNFDADDLGIPQPDGTYRWYHLQIHGCYSSSADAVVDEEGIPYVRNPHTGRLVPIEEGSADHERIERIRKGIKSRPKPRPRSSAPIERIPPVGSHYDGRGNLIWH
ncbi:MAG: RHS repeat-associated core domain-containing protein [Fimbriimonadaceae bacterium]|nr:MAG: RHS repeat-associated core domain-containing protein [Fimbriimonadaceae bacterium]